MLLPSLSKVNWFGSKLPGTSSSCPLLSVTIQLVKTKEETREEDEEKETFAFEMENRKKESEDARNEDEMSDGLYRSSRHTSNSLSFFCRRERRGKKRIRFTCSVAPLFLPSRLYHFLSSYPSIFCSKILPFSSSHHLQRRIGREMGMRKVMTNMCKNNNSSLKGIQLQFQFHSICTFLPCSFPVSSPSFQ